MHQRIDLNGAWELAWFDGHRGTNPGRMQAALPDPHFRITGQVPGEVHLDLVRSGIIGDPSVGLNCLAARWVEEMVWLYRRTFEAPALAAGERAWLVFDGLDLAATITLNGEEIASHANAFYPCRVDVTDRLQHGMNSLTVAVESGLFYAAERPATGYGLQLDGKLHKRHWLRTVQSSFAWDWAPRLLNVGITGDVRLEFCLQARFDRLVALARLSDDLQQGAVTVRVFAEGLGDAAQPGKLTATVVGPRGRAATGGATTGGSPLQAVADVTIQPGLHAVEVTIPVAQPELWWPVNHGAQPLYTVQAALEVGGQVIGGDVRRVGFRHVRVNQDPHPQGGSYFVIEINGKPIFVKGANFVPADMIPARLDRARYATLVDRALEANFNLLRIWGGGLYESDDFYEICDARGVLVWQEFIFACAKYPAYDEAFLADVKQEAAHQVRRLAHHPSLIVWCGNNEMEEGNYHWGYEKGVAYPDYALFHMVLPVILKQEDGTRYYQPSSPYSPDHESPRRPDMGDQHPWTVGFANTDFRDYREMISRFPNEGGILGPTSLPTVLACLPPGQRYPGSFAWEVHDNSVSYWGGARPYPDVMLEQWLGKPLTSMSLEDYVYYAGVVQGEGLTEYIRNFRRRMFSSASAVFWMYNDCWPATRSWTIVDYYLRRTPAFYAVKRACKPLSVALAVEDGMVRVYGVNEGPEWQGELRCGLFALAGGYPVEIFKSIQLPANASTLVAEFSAATWDDLGVTTHGAFAILSLDGQEAARDRLFQPYYKELVWSKAQVRVRRGSSKAVFESDIFAWRVCLDLDGEHALPDNFFDVLPGIPTVLDWPEELGEPRILRVGNL